MNPVCGRAEGPRRRSRRRTGATAALVLGLLASGCASSGSAVDSAAEAEPVTGQQVFEYTNVYQALQELRPSWVRRAREVFIDEEFAGTTSLLRRSFSEEIRLIELIPAREVVRRFGPCQAPAGTGVIDTPRDPQCGTRPVIHIVRYAR